MSALTINEIFYSIQGESTWAGLPCVFVRLTGCPLRCGYCDTEYAFREGSRKSVQEVLDAVTAFGCNLVEITGGEPLVQKAVHPLMRAMCDQGRTVLLETSGACDISPCDPRVIRILDLKTPGSGEVVRNLWSNVAHLAGRDEVKFVITDRADYEWAIGIMRQYDLAQRVHALLLSPVFEMGAGRELPGAKSLSPRDLAQWILADHLPPTVRMQLQLHKFIWEPATRGV